MPIKLFSLDYTETHHSFRTDKQRKGTLLGRSFAAFLSNDKNKISGLHRIDSKEISSLKDESRVNRHEESERTCYLDRNDEKQRPHDIGYRKERRDDYMQPFMAPTNYNGN